MGISCSSDIRRAGLEGMANAITPFLSRRLYELIRHARKFVELIFPMAH